MSVSYTHLDVYKRQAQMCGFHNKAHFHQQFQFYIGHTPRHHRIITKDCAYPSSINEKIEATKQIDAP